MNRKSTVPFVGVRLHENRTPTGRQTSTPAKRVALYFAYGSGRSPEGKEARLTGVQRGEWLSPDGREQTHDEVMTWLREESLRNQYTFEALLSVRNGDLTSEAFCKAMGQREIVSDWRLVMHNDTNNRHAHVLFFGDKRMEKKAFLAWQAEVRAELVAQENLHPDVVRRQHSEMDRGAFDRLSTGKLAQAYSAEPALALPKEPDLDLSTDSSETLSKEPALSSSKGWGIGA